MTPRQNNPSNGSLAHRLPGFDAQHATRRSRTTGRLLISVIVVAAAVALALYFTGFFKKNHGHVAASVSPASSAGSGTSSSGTGGSSSSSHGSAPSVIASLFSPQLTAPITRALVLPGPGTQIVIAGGETAGGILAQGIFTLDTSSGKLQHVGNFATGIDGAAGAVIAGQDVTFGGDAPTPIPDVQSLPVTTSASSSPSTAAAGHGAVQAASPLGALPDARADGAATAIGTTTYIVGGDNGSSAEAPVISTRDGRTFTTVASLEPPVTFAAAAAVGSNVYVFGGQSSSSPGSWSPVETIQKVEPAHHRAVVVGHLPIALSGASAVSVDNGILLIGGTTGAVATGQSQAVPASASSTSTTSTTNAAGPVANTEASIWWFDPVTNKTTLVGQLPQAVCQAGVVASGSTIWVVGGTANGSAVPTLQTIRVTPAAQGSGGTKTKS